MCSSDLIGFASSPERGSFLHIRKPYGFIANVPVSSKALPLGRAGIASAMAERVRFLLHSVPIYAILPFAVLFCAVPLEQLRILGSPVRLEPRRAKPTGAGGPVRSKSNRWSIIMNQNSSVRKLVRCGLVAALYVVLCLRSEEHTSELQSP